MTENNKLPEASILVAVDFSKDSEEALVWASKYAKLSQMPLNILHVVHDPADAPGYYKTDEKDVFLTLKDVAKKKLDEFVEKVGRAEQGFGEILLANKILISGIPANRILETAEKINAKHIVIGSSGRSRIARFFLGSKALRVAQMSPIPVTVVRGEKTSEQ
jgi:nucleotide-binding universal stress UspA family protein